MPSETVMEVVQTSKPPESAQKGTRRRRGNRPAVPSELRK